MSAKLTRVQVIAFSEAPEPGAFELRLKWTPGEDERTHWVDFELFQVLGVEGDVGKFHRRCYQRRGATSSPDPVYTLDEAECISGMLKWDGCMQFRMLDPVHVDTMESLDALHGALRRTRIEAAKVMGDVYEYPDELAV